MPLFLDPTAPDRERQRACPAPTQGIVRGGESNARDRRVRGSASGRPTSLVTHYMAAVSEPR